MAGKFIVVSCFMALNIQVSLTQSPLQYNILSLPMAEVVETPRNYITQAVSPVLTESPCNVQIPLSSGPSSTTIITDCSPTACKNLANTLQLMIVCNLLQNTNGGSDLALQLATPIINELFTTPVLPCGCTNPFATNVVSPNVVSSNVISPNVISPTVVSPTVVGSTNLVSGLANPVSNVSPLLLSSLLQGLF